MKIKSKEIIINTLTAAPTTNRLGTRELTSVGNICFDCATDNFMKSSAYLTPEISFSETASIPEVSRGRLI